VSLGIGLEGSSFGGAKKWVVRARHIPQAANGLATLMAYALCYIPHSACMFVLRTVRAFTLYDKATRPSQLC
jgi:hypothetical protein